MYQRSCKKKTGPKMICKYVNCANKEHWILKNIYNGTKVSQFKKK